MTYEEKFSIALNLENVGISHSNLVNLQNAIYMGDQELVNSDYAWMHKTLENIGVTPKNLKDVIRFMENF